MRNGKIQCALLAASLLGGCNLVISEQPWFAADAAAPRLKQGLWVNLDPNGCTFDSAKPVDDWPECAEPMIVRGDSYVVRDENSENGNKWEELAHVVAAGTPLVDQIEWRRKDKAAYLYMGLAATARDADGAITEVKRWLVQCGPLDPPGKDKQVEAGPPRMVTSRPFAGLTLDASNNCTAASADALRGAAGLSEALASEDGNSPVMGHWVREGSR